MMLTFPECFRNKSQRTEQNRFRSRTHIYMLDTHISHVIPGGLQFTTVPQRLERTKLKSNYPKKLDFFPFVFLIPRKKASKEH